MCTFVICDCIAMLLLYRYLVIDITLLFFLSNIYLHSTRTSSSIGTLKVWTIHTHTHTVYCCMYDDSWSHACNLNCCFNAESWKKGKKQKGSTALLLASVDEEPDGSVSKRNNVFSVTR